MGITDAKSKPAYGFSAETLCGGKVSGNGSVFCAPFARVDEGRGKQRRCGTQIVISVGRHAVHDPGAQPLKRRVEHSIAGADAGLASVAEEGLQKSILEARRIGQTDPGSKVVILAPATASKESRDRRRPPIPAARWEENRLLAGNNRLDVVVFFRPRLDQIPTHAEVYRQVASRPPAIFDKSRCVMVPEIEVLTRWSG